MLSKIRYLSLLLLCCASLTQADTSSNTRFNNLRANLFSDPYETLPYYKVTRSLFGKRKDDNLLLKAARRTFNDERDLIEFPQGQKLLQANGICFSGQWQINQGSEFTGLFAQGTNSPAIVRASVSLSGVRQKDKRAFGMGIKLLPDNLGDRGSLNFFVMNTFGGVVEKYMLDLSLDNEPPLGRIPRLRDVSTALRLRKDLLQADSENGAQNPQVNYRPVNHLAEYDGNSHEPNNSPERNNSPELNNNLEPSKKNVSIAPKWIRLSPLTEQRVDEDDFRDELQIQHYTDQQLLYQIDVAADNADEKNKSNKSKANWQTIGTLSLHDSVRSISCDQRLHFTHPKLISAQ